MGAFATVAGLGIAGVLATTLFSGTGFGQLLRPFRPGFPIVTSLGIIGAALASSRRPDGRLATAQLRGALGWGAFMFAQSPQLVSRTHPAAANAGVTLAFLSWAAWAWLGPRAKQRTPRVARAFRILAGVLAAASVVPWFLVD